MTDIRKKALLIAPLVVVIIIALVIFSHTDNEQDDGFNQVDDATNASNDNKDETLENEESLDEADSEQAVVDIKGEVEEPGIYEIDTDKRVDDVLELAGGFTDKADAMQVNRAEKVHDEMVIAVPEEGEEAAGPANAEDETSNEKIRINQASQEEIESLSGIGPSKAEAIIDYREDNGPFEDEKDLLEVSGLGEKTLENLQDDILVP